MTRNINVSDLQLETRHLQHATRNTQHATLNCNSCFTMVELVSILVIVGIMAAIAIPRFANVATYSARGYADTAAGFLRYAQKLAIARHATTTVQIGTSGLALCSTASCTDANPWPGPQGETPYRLDVPSGVTQTGSSASMTFDDNGVPSPSTGVTLTITGDTVRTLTVEPGTGYVH